MIRKLSGLPILRIFLILLFFCLFVSACQKKENVTDSTRSEQSVTSAGTKTPAGSPEVSKVKVSKAPGSGAKPASIPASLFKIPDKKMMNENYDKLKDRMLGDLESDLKWQEKLENLEREPASGAQKK